MSYRTILAIVVTADVVLALAVAHSVMCFLQHM